MPRMHQSCCAQTPGEVPPEVQHSSRNSEHGPTMHGQSSWIVHHQIRAAAAEVSVSEAKRLWINVMLLQTRSSHLLSLFSSVMLKNSLNSGFSLILLKPYSSNTSITNLNTLSSGPQSNWCSYCRMGSQEWKGVSPQTKKSWPLLGHSKLMAMQSYLK